MPAGFRVPGERRREHWLANRPGVSNGWWENLSCLLAKNEKQILLDANGKPVSADHRPTGSDLYTSNYEKVDRMFKKKELLQTENVQKEAIKKVVGQVPQKLPAMPRKGV